VPTRTTTILLVPREPSRSFLPCLSLGRSRRFCTANLMLKSINAVVVADSPTSFHAASRILSISSALRRPSLVNGVVFTWSREHIDSRTKRQIGFCALFPFPSLSPFRSPPSSRVVFPSSSPRRRDIYGELYGAFRTDNRGGVLIRVCFRRMRIARGITRIDIA